MRHVRSNALHGREAIFAEEAKKASKEWPTEQALDQSISQPSDSGNLAAIIDRVIHSRKSVRAFRPDPVPKRLLMEILETARAAPSNFNSQPWRVYLLTGEPKRVLSEAILQAHIANAMAPFSPFPQPMPMDCGARVDDFGRRYYSALGIDRADMVARARQTGRNFLFFDAPVGLIFTIHATLTKHSWLDCGLFLQNLMLAAHVRGLATCPQVSFVRFQSIIAEQLELGTEELVTCGMSCGYADGQAAVNQLDMPREPVKAFTRWLGFEE
jgi:nitroreductase